MNKEDSNSKEKQASDNPSDNTDNSVLIPSEKQDIVPSKNKNRGKKDWPNVVQAIFTVLICFVTIAYVLVTFCQWNTMSRQLDVAKDTFDSGQKSFEATMKEMQKQSGALSETAKTNKLSAETTRLLNRAFIYFLDPDIFPYPSSDKTVTWGLSIVLQNAGNMPARRVSVRCTRVEFPANKDIHDPWILAQGNWHNVEVPNVVGSKAILKLPVPDIPLGMMAQVKNLKSVIYIFMETTYFDGFEIKQHRVTQMSRVFRYDAEGGTSLHFTRTHNCTDDDCKKQ